jgi:D-amino-acid dehydrogenase
VCGAWFHRKDSHLRPDAFISAWSRAAQQRGVSILEKCRLLRFSFHNGQVVAARTTAGRFTADQFILATGAWSTDIVGQLGLRIPVQPGKGYSITMQRPAVCPTIPCYLYEKRVVVTPWQSGYRLGGTMEFSGFDDRLDEVRLANLVDAAQQYLRTPVGTPEYERWAGWRPMCADDLPIIDRVPPADNLYIATGHGMLGLTTATGTGRLLTDMVIGRRPPCDPEPFSLTRF